MKVEVLLKFDDWKVSYGKKSKKVGLKIKNKENS